MSRRAPPEERYSSADAGPLFNSAAATARDIGHRAASAAAAKASAIEPGWKSSAVETVRAYAMSHAGPFLSEDALASVSMPEGSDRRAFGAVMKEAERLGYIKAAGYLPARTSNSAPKTAWASRIFEGSSRP